MRKVALIIGVEEYRDQMISRLKFARADAVALAEHLRNRCKFDNVRLLADNEGLKAPDLGNIVDNLQELKQELRPEDLFLFFFSGHGIEKKERGYLLTRDTRQALPEHGSLGLSVLEDTLNELEAGQRILLIDACRNSPQAAKGDTDNRMEDAIAKDIAATARSRSKPRTTTALLSACRAGQRAYEWPKRGHGVFTYFLLQGIDSAAWTRDKLEFDHLAEYTATEVQRWSSKASGLSTPQQPWFEKFGDPVPILLAQRAPSKKATVGFKAAQDPKVVVEKIRKWVENRKADWKDDEWKDFVISLYDDGCAVGISHSKLEKIRDCEKKVWIKSEEARKVEEARIAEQHRRAAERAERRRREAEEARKCREEEQLFDEIKNSPTIQLCQRYLNQYSNGKYLKKVCEKLKRLEDMEANRKIHTKDFDRRFSPMEFFDYISIFCFLIGIVIISVGLVMMAIPNTFQDVTKISYKFYPFIVLIGILIMIITSAFSRGD